MSFTKKFRRGSKFPPLSFVNGQGVATLTFGHHAFADPPQLLAGVALLRFTATGRGRVNHSARGVAALNFTGSAKGAGIHKNAEGTAALTFGGWAHGRKKTSGAGQADLSFDASADLVRWSWALVNTALPYRPTMRALAVSDDGQTIIVGVTSEAHNTSRYLYVSTDGGQTFTPGALEKNWLAVAMSADGQRIYAAAGRTDTGVSFLAGGLWRSTDGGASWSQLLATNQAAVACSEDGLTLVSCPDTGSPKASTDGGDSFTNVTVSGSATQVWSSASISRDGSRIYLVNSLGYVLRGTPASVQETIHSTSDDWTSPVCSEDGQTVFAPRGKPTGSDLSVVVDKSTDGFANRTPLAGPVGYLINSTALRGDDQKMVLVFFPNDGSQGYRTLYTTDGWTTEETIPPDIAWVKSVAASQNATAFILLAGNSLSTATNLYTNKTP